MTVIRIAFIIGIILFLIGCSEGQGVNKHDYGDSWPFLVDSGHVACYNKGEVVFIHNGDVYALNSAAIRSKKYLSIESMRKHNPPPSSTKMSFKNMIEVGLKECQ